MLLYYNLKPYKICSLYENIIRTGSILNYQWFDASYLLKYSCWHMMRKRILHRLNPQWSELRGATANHNSHNGTATVSSKVDYYYTMPCIVSSWNDNKVQAFCWVVGAITIWRLKVSTKTRRWIHNDQPPVPQWHKCAVKVFTAQQITKGIS